MERSNKKNKNYLKQKTKHEKPHQLREQKQQQQQQLIWATNANQQVKCAKKRSFIYEKMKWKWVKILKKKRKNVLHFCFCSNTNKIIIKKNNNRIIVNSNLNGNEKKRETHTQIHPNTKAFRNYLSVAHSTPFIEVNLNTEATKLVHTQKGWNVNGTGCCHRNIDEKCQLHARSSTTSTCHCTVNLELILICIWMNDRFAMKQRLIGQTFKCQFKSLIPNAWMFRNCAMKLIKFTAHDPSLLNVCEIQDHLR